MVNEYTIDLSDLIDIKTDGSFRLRQSYFDYCTGLTMTNELADELLEGKLVTQISLTNSIWTLPLVFNTLLKILS